MCGANVASVTDIVDVANTIGAAQDASSINDDKAQLKDLVARYALAHSSSYLAVFVNGVLQRDVSDVADIPITVPANTRLDKPLHLLFFFTNNNTRQMQYDNFITIGECSQATIIEEHVVFALPSAVTVNSQIKVQSQAQVEYYKIHSAARAASAINAVCAYGNDCEINNDEGNYYGEGNKIATNLQLMLATGSTITTHHLIFADNDLKPTIDADTARNEKKRGIKESISASLTASHVTCINRGLYVLYGNDADLDVNIEHVAPYCASKELFKGIIAGNARATFVGRITVRENAQHSATRLDNKNLLLDDAARVTTSPALEIYTDDVQCSHGATVGQLDNGALWYLQSRGIPHEVARHMLMRAFMQEITNTLPRCLQEKIAANFDDCF